MVQGFKCFNKDLTNNYGFQFEVGKTYSVEGEIQAGLRGNGFHMCKNMEDTLRYFGMMNPDISVCEVIGSGQIVTFNDEYNGYYDLYSVEKIEIVRLLSTKEIIDMALSFRDEKVIRFIISFKLNHEELELFKEHFSNNATVLRNIAYYQEGDVYAFAMPKKLSRRLNHY